MMQKHQRRNCVAKAAIMRKGGAHEKSNKAKRQKDRQAFKKKMRAEQFGSFYLCGLKYCALKNSF